ncbi:MAG TPA: hypothetical protein VGM88_29390 [Kofleriaceae bacterium]|jgi:hypothetical protein
MKQAAIVVLVALATFALHVYFQGMHALAAGDAALKAGHSREAVAHYEAAARAYVPVLGGHRSAAITALDHLALDEKRDAPTRLAAFRALRATAIATRSAFAPSLGACDLACADAHIAQLSAADPEGAPAAGDTPAARLAWYQQQLSVDPRPAPWPVLLTSFGLVAFLIGAALVVRRPRWCPGIVAVVGLAVWAAGLYNA